MFRCLRTQPHWIRYSLYQRPKCAFSQDYSKVDLSDYDRCVEVLRQSYAGQADFSPESIQYGKEFKPENNDVVINSGGKSGTIWVAWILFLLKCKCDPLAIDKIKEIEDFLPFIPTCFDYSFLINDSSYEQEYSPRFFMHHASVEDSYTDEPLENCRLITLFRDPKDIFYSRYRMYNEIYCLGQGELNFDAFAHVVGIECYKNYPHGPLINPYVYYESWGKFFAKYNFNYKPTEKNVLALFYDDLIEDRLKCIQEIERHTNINNPDNNNDQHVQQTLEDQVFKLSSHEEMSKIGEKFVFGKAQVKRSKLQEGKEPKVFNKNHVRKDGGKIGQGKKKMPQKWVQHCDMVWKQHIEPIVGCKDYHQFRQKMSFLHA